MIIHETLGQLGLSIRQTDIYLTLLKQGPGSIREIAIGAGINRGTTYEELKILRKKSLVSYSPRGKRKFFCAEPPDRLMQLASERHEALCRNLVEASEKRLNRVDLDRSRYRPR
jgi:sugar-specific transcriptional regulator TrmB